MGHGIQELGVGRTVGSADVTSAAVAAAAAAENSRPTIANRRFGDAFDGRLSNRASELPRFPRLPRFPISRLSNFPICPPPTSRPAGDGQPYLVPPSSASPNLPRLPSLPPCRLLVPQSSTLPLSQFPTLPLFRPCLPLSPHLCCRVRPDGTHPAVSVLKNPRAPRNAAASRVSAGPGMHFSQLTLQVSA